MSMASKDGIDKLTNMISCAPEGYGYGYAILMIGKKARQ